MCSWDPRATLAVPGCHIIGCIEVASMLTVV